MIVRESSGASAIRSDGATDGGSHDPSRLGPPVVAMKKAVPGKPPKEALSEKSGFSNGDYGFRGLLEGRFGADDAPRENTVLIWTQRGVYFQSSEDQELNSSLESGKQAARETFVR
jgi:hypothetical protein